MERILVQWTDETGGKHEEYFYWLSGTVEVKEQAHACGPDCPLHPKAKPEKKSGEDA